MHTQTQTKARVQTMGRKNRLPLRQRLDEAPSQSGVTPEMKEARNVQAGMVELMQWLHCAVHNADTDTKMQAFDEGIKALEARGLDPQAIIAALEG